MPRVSAAAQALPGDPPVKLKPPDHLAEASRRIWQEITEALPATWFGPEHSRLLAAYCDAAVFVERLSAAIHTATSNDACDAETSKVIYRLTRMYAMHTSTMTALSVRLRITPSANVRPQQHQNQRAQHVAGSKPWENWQLSNCHPDA
jgi:phage terminase small subunit